ncbi:hypothetical protein A5621_13450 [Mycobacterium colombiense]|uniref:hypothetical protein n=1 Tax=Mycobacterium colombiense TaxID=339268 RepID=UPI0007FD8819|nr:hypothetical protein [Mycobacterium colombiense]OBJ38361.1 hypothetical protein A5621_13450 [Mycobacterium colombiense]
MTVEGAGKKPWKFRLPELADTEDEFIDIAVERTGMPRSTFQMPHSEAHHYEYLPLVTDPELAQKLLWPNYIACMQLVLGEDAPNDMAALRSPEIRSNPKWQILMLMLQAYFSVHAKNEYWAVLLSLEPMPYNDHLLGFPDADSWSDEQRLALKFLGAAVNREMTDELWEAAVKTWGTQLTMRYLAFVGYYVSYDILMSACGLTKWHGPILAE